MCVHVCVFVCVCMCVCLCVCACGMCVNQVGGYSCQCHDGYTLYTDGFSCNETTGTTYIGVCVCVCMCVCLCVCACGMCVFVCECMWYVCEPGGRLLVSVP